MDIWNVIWHIKVCGNFDYTESELERIGLEGICKEYNLEYSDLSEREKRFLWEELRELAREVEFNRDWNYELD